MSASGGEGGGETANGNGHGGGASPGEAQSFVVRAFVDPTSGPGAWRGLVTHTGTGERRAWRRSSEVVRLLDRWLAELSGTSIGAGPVAAAGTLMAAPPFADVVADMLALLQAQLPPMPAGLPGHNVTLEQVTQRLVGLGNHRGDERGGVLTTRTLRGGRLSGRVRFQIWGTSPTGVDDAVLALQSDLLDEGETLRQDGFLRLMCTDTTLAEPVDSVNGWRKATSYDVLYEYTYVDSDDADSLIARIPVTLDPEHVNSPAREQQTLSDDMVRWDDEAAPALVVRGPAVVHRLSALLFQPGPAVGGTAVVARTTGGGPAMTHLPDLASFLAATGGSEPTHHTADVTLTVADLCAGIGASGAPLDLGDWDADGVTDSYTSFDRTLDDPIRLATAEDRMSITYTPPGSGAGLDQTAVVYLRANAP